MGIMIGDSMMLCLSVVLIGDDDSISASHAHCSRVLVRVKMLNFV